MIKIRSDISSKIYDKFLQKNLVESIVILQIITMTIGKLLCQFMNGTNTDMMSNMIMVEPYLGMNQVQ